MLRKAMDLRKNIKLDCIVYDVQYNLIRKGGKLARELVTISSPNSWPWHANHQFSLTC
jgi:hypothetical protein